MKHLLIKPMNRIWTHLRRRGPGILGLAAAGIFLSLPGTSRGQAITVSPAAQQAHSQITAYNGPSTCVACHQTQATQMFGSVHYQEMGDTPAVPNIDGQAGKGINAGRVMNSYCGTPTTSSRATCATCHVGNGRIPSPQLTTEQLNNIDCLMCHQDAYKRVPTGTFDTVTMPGPTAGSTHTIQAVIEDPTGFDFIPDQNKMTITILQAAQTVHRPTRASCLRCHAGAGGSDGGKRGDISTVTVNPPVTSDIHMSPQGQNLGCVNCHSAGGHRVSGRGVDLRPSDSTQTLDCSKCHTTSPHAASTTLSSANATLLNTHANHVACQTCHIPSFAKDVSTEMERSWLQATFSQAACRGQGGWVPSDVRASKVTPIYKWFDGTSMANVLGQVPALNAQGEYVLAWPNGSVQSTGAKIYPMKLHKSNSAIQDSTGLLIPHSTFAYFTSGDFSAAVAEGQQLSGLTGASRVVAVQEYQTINHGVEAKANALQCGACHSAYTTGGPVRMNLQNDLGYGLKGALSQVCSQCHSSRSSPGFASVHSIHVSSRSYDCSNCHGYSRPERNLTRATSSLLPVAPGATVAFPVSASQIKVVWPDNSSTETGFQIERSFDGVSFAQIGTVGANVTSTLDSNVSAGRSHFYRVRAYNSTGSSAYSMIGRATPGGGSTVEPAPTAPTALTATAVSATEVRLAWTDNANNETGFVVERSLDNVSFTQAATLGANVTAYSDTGLSASRTYYYRVRAVNGTGASANSNTATVTTQAGTVSLPAIPSGLNATAGDTRVTLSWNAAAGATSYNIKRATTSGGPYNTIASGTGTSYADTSVVNGTTYYYVVSAVNTAGQSGNSSQVSATPQGTVTVWPPTGLTAQAQERRSISLQWQQSTSSGISRNRIYRSTSREGSYTLLDTISAGTSYLDNSRLQRGRTYYYVVTAVNRDGTESAYSVRASATAR